MIVAMFTTFIISYWASKFIVGDNKSHVSSRTQKVEGGWDRIGKVVRFPVTP